MDVCREDAEAEDGLLLLALREEEEEEEEEEVEVVEREEDDAGRADVVETSTFLVLGAGSEGLARVRFFSER